ncbi:hypothetical protein NOVO_00785 [Rickettsiales bacterium Ac37b]|nr:hypothetical protein NOVO_00785 [Rickettsiales bacterium Ac37b]
MIRSKKFIITILSIIYISFSIFFYLLYEFVHSQKFANQQNVNVAVDKVLAPVFTPEGIEDIALVLMVKDEIDIIMENLVWHFCIGFRKFIIIDNQSSDGTREHINKFARLTKDIATVLIIDDPIVEHIQTRIITGAYYYITQLWPSVKWVFPIDADEFWVPQSKLSQILSQIPDKYDALTVLRTRYFANKNYYNYPDTIPFYEKIPFRTKNLTLLETEYSHINYKIALRTGRNNLIITQGNHALDTKIPHKFKDSFNYIGGNTKGLHMVEYTMRSVEQTNKKFQNGMNALISASKKNLPETRGMESSHWYQYKKYINQYGKLAAKAKFEKNFITAEDSIYDPLPIQEAFVLFKKILNNYQACVKF